MAKSLVLSLICLFFAPTLKASEPSLLLKGYTELHKALAGDKIKDAQTLDAQLKVEALAKSKDDQEARKAFGVYSEQVVELVRKNKELQNHWQLFYCPMVPKGTYGYWVQPKGESLLNPYYGAKMLTCGVKRPW